MHYFAVSAVKMQYRCSFNCCESLAYQVTCWNRFWCTHGANRNLFNWGKRCMGCVISAPPYMFFQRVALDQCNKCVVFFFSLVDRLCIVCTDVNTAATRPQLDKLAGRTNERLPKCHCVSTIRRSVYAWKVKSWCCVTTGEDGQRALRQSISNWLQSWLNSAMSISTG